MNLEFAVMLVCTAAGVLCGGAIGLLCVRKFTNKETGRMSAGGAALSWLAAFMGWQLASVLCRCLAYIIMGFADPGPLFADGNAAERVLLYGAASLPVSLLYSLIALPVLIVLLPAARWAYSEMKGKTAEKKKGTARAWTAVFYAAFTAVSALVIAVPLICLEMRFPPDGVDFVDRVPLSVSEIIQSMGTREFALIILSVAAGLLCGGAVGLLCIKGFTNKETGRVSAWGTVLSVIATVVVWETVMYLVSAALLTSDLSFVGFSPAYLDYYIFYYSLPTVLPMFFITSAAWWIWRRIKLKTAESSKSVRTLSSATLFVGLALISSVVFNAVVCMRVYIYF